jgi:hypothetical protein
MDEDDPVPGCSFSTIDLSKRGLFTANALIEITIGTDTFEFYVDSVSIDRNDPGSVRVDVQGVDATSYYDFPRALPMSKTWDTDTNASVMVGGLLSGASVNWGIVDWVIPAFRVAIDNGNPMTLATEIVAAAGGLLESDLGGGFNVRYLHTFATNILDTITPDYEYFTAKDILSVPERFNVADYYDRLRVLDIETGDFQDAIQFEEDELDSFSGTLRVWPYPYDAGVTVTHTSDDDVNLSRIGVVTTVVEDEVVEIFDGSGQTQFPIYAIDNVEWLKENLLGLAFETYTPKVTSTHADKKYSLVRISYRTRAIHYRASVLTSPAVQFLVNRS